MAPANLLLCSIVGCTHFGIINVFCLFCKCVSHLKSKCHLDSSERGSESLLVHRGEASGVQPNHAWAAHHFEMETSPCH